MTADTDRWLALCDEADGEHSEAQEENHDYCYECGAFKREPELTRAVRELVAENERLRKALVLAWPHLEAVFHFAGIHGLTKPVPEIVALAKVVGTISSIVVD